MSRAKVRETAHEAIAKGTPLAWYDQVYGDAAGETNAVPWADLVVNPSLTEWWHDRNRSGEGAALVVGCGLGDDAEWLASKGMKVTAFDISPNAIAWAKKRFPESNVDYRAADLLAPPTEWTRAFDFVFEAYTLQAMHAELRPRAASMLPRFVAPGGTLLVVARGADGPSRLEDGPPWPLAKSEIVTAASDADRTLKLASWEDFVDAEGERRFRATFEA